MELKFVSYLTEKFNVAKFDKIKNKTKGIRHKPIGGLWASPIGKNFYTWQDFCKENQYDGIKGKIRFEFCLKHGSKILWVTTPEELGFFLGRYSSASSPDVIDEMKISLDYLDKEIVDYDYERIKKDGYNAIYFGLSEYPTLRQILYGMDVDTLLVLDPDCIEPCK